MVASRFALLGAVCFLSGRVAWGSDEYITLSDAPAPPSLALYVPPPTGGLRQGAVPEQKAMPAASSPSAMAPPSASSPGGARMPATPAAPVASPAFNMPKESPVMQMPAAAPAVPMVMMPAPVYSPGTQTGPQLFSGFFAGLSASFALGFAIVAKRMYDGTNSSDESLEGSAGNLELGKLQGRAGVPTMNTPSMTRREMAVGFGAAALAGFQAPAFAETAAEKEKRKAEELQETLAALKKGAESAEASRKTLGFDTFNPNAVRSDRDIFSTNRKSDDPNGCSEECIAKRIAKYGYGGTY